MSHTLELLSTAPHGTVDGYRAGCHGSTVSCGAPVSCADVYRRYQGDWGFRKRVDAGEQPADIIAEEAAEAAAVRARDKAANRRAKAEGAQAAEAREQKQRRQSTSSPTRAVESVAEKIRDDVARLVKTGATVRGIAATLGVSYATVIRARRMVGLTRVQMSINRDDVARLHAEKMNDTQIAERLGATSSTISAIRRDELHLTVNKTRRPSVEGPRALRRRQVTELHARGKTDKEIAEALGIPYIIARQNRKRYGLPLNPDPNRYSGRRARVTQEDTPTPGEVTPVVDEPTTPAEHGTPEGYEAGCRGRDCPSAPTCKDAALAAHRAARRAAQEGTS